jgi:MarR family transcriptional regulator, transcriptional regulator for hemolysin
MFATDLAREPRSRRRNVGDAAARAREAASGLYPLARSLGYHVRELSESWQAAMDAEAEKYGISLTQWRYLRELWEEDGLTSGELTRRVGRQGPTTVVAVKSMERAGLVRVEKSDHDRRKSYVRLTARGRRLATMMSPVIQRINDLAVADLSASELRLLKQLVVRIQRKLDAHGRHRNSWLVWRTDRLAEEAGA